MFNPFDVFPWAKGQPCKESELMKTVSLWMLAAAVILFPGVGGSLAFAQGGGNGDGHSPPPTVVRQLRHRLLHRFDENGNGRLDHRESHQALRTVLRVLSRNHGRPINISELPAGLRPIFAMFDRNRDGVLGPIEQQRLAHAMRHAARPVQRPHPPRPPGDGEGGADKPEKPRPKPPGEGDADEDGSDGPNRPHPPRLTPELLRQLRALLLAAFDRNHNRHLDPPERCHARRVLLGFLKRHRGEDIEIASAPPRLGRILGLFDFNGDGKLGPAEKRLLHRALHIVLRPRPRPEPNEPGDGDRPQRPRPDRPIGEDLDDSRPDDRPADGGFEVRPGPPPRPDF